ncbi:hypothetical protein T492DRAFT_1046926 [Pavlovales sp. CCMP2436]|nr:hypothetical protein T492DRAFT_1046926 [Pavlovales sp. CCMP2436]
MLRVLAALVTLTSVAGGGVTDAPLPTCSSCPPLLRYDAMRVRWSRANGTAFLVTDAPLPTCSSCPPLLRYDAMRIRWSSANGTAFLVRATGAVGGGVVASMVLGRESALLPCEVGERYSVRIELHSSLADALAEIPSQLHLPIGARSQGLAGSLGSAPLATRRRVTDFGAASYMAGAGYARNEHVSTLKLTCGAGARETLAVPHGHAPLVGEWVPTRNDDANRPWLLMPLPLWSAHILEIWRRQVTRWAPKIARECPRSGPRRCVPSPHEFRWRPFSPLSEDQAGRPTELPLAHCGRYSDGVTAGSESASALLNATVLRTRAMAQDYNVRGALRRPAWVHGAGDSVMSGVFAALSLLLGKQGTAANRQDSGVLLAIASEQWERHRRLAPACMTRLTFGGVRLSFCEHVSRVISGGFDRPPPSLLEEMGLQVAAKCRAAFPPELAESYTADDGFCGEAAGCSRSPCALQASSAPDILLLNSGLWDVQDRPPGEYASQLPRLLAFLEAHLPPATTVVWLAPAGYFLKEGVPLHTWRSTVRLRQHARAIFQAAAQTIRWQPGARERWVFLDPSALLAAIEPVGSAEGDGRHWKMFVNMHLASVVLNAVHLNADGSGACSARGGRGDALYNRAKFAYGEGP